MSTLTQPQPHMAWRLDLSICPTTDGAGAGVGTGSRMRERHEVAGCTSPLHAACRRRTGCIQATYKRHTGDIQVTYRQHTGDKLKASPSVVLTPPINNGSSGEVFKLFYRYHLAKDRPYLKLPTSKLPWDKLSSTHNKGIRRRTHHTRHTTHEI